MSNLFKKANKIQPAQTQRQEREPSKLFINLGFEKQYGEEIRFVNIPLVLTADQIQQGIDNLQKSVSANSPDEWREFIADRLLLAKDVQSLFEQMDEGTQLVNTDIPEYHELGYLSGLQVQFVHRKDKEQIEFKDVDAKDRRKAFMRK